jgi:ArsR family transcriptional regulator
MEKRQFARIAKALADPRRFEILSRIAANAELSCASLRQELPITAATLSHHLKELETAGLIECRRNSKYMFLQLCRPVWKAYLKELQKITA